MAMKVEVEKKFYCKNEQTLLKLLEKQGMNKVSTKKEKDEYFTDSNSEYIKNRTCLRLRETDDGLTLTFKGKSVEFGNAYAKVENDINLDKTEYKNIYEILTSLGFCSYTIVSKKRSTYTKKKDNLTFNVMIDFIENVGNFVEFELLCFDEKYDLNNLKEKLNNFIALFEELKFEEANLPYRDFVANNIYQNIKLEGKISALLIDFDGTLVNTEKTFFESFKIVLKNNYNVDITFSDYKKHELEKNEGLISYLKNVGKINMSEPIDKIMQLVYDEYKKELSFAVTSNEEILNFKLLKKLKELGLKLGLVSTSKKEYIDIILKKLRLDNLFDTIISREDTEKLKPEPDAYITAINNLNVSPNECLAVEDSKRGIEAALKAKIKTIQVKGFNEDNENYFSVPKIDKVSRLTIILINHL